MEEKVGSDIHKDKRDRSIVKKTLSLTHSPSDGAWVGEGRMGRNDAVEMNGDRSRPGCCPARPASDTEASGHSRR
jgi:hypothetical protein